MKPYVKPALTAFSLSGNETLCGGCGFKLADQSDWALEDYQAEWEVEDLTNDGPTRDDFISYFANSADSCSKYPIFDVFGYCKFQTSSQILWS